MPKKTLLTLPISSFRGFLSTNEILIQTADNLIVVRLSNCDQNKDRPSTSLVEFATFVFDKISENKWDLVDLEHWDFPKANQSSTLQTAKQASQAQFRNELIDRQQSSVSSNHFIGLIVFKFSLSQDRKTQAASFDMREEGLKKRWLVLNSLPNWTQESTSQKAKVDEAIKSAARSLKSTTSKQSPPVQDFRNQQEISLTNPFICSLSVNKDKVGMAIGTNGIMRKKIEKDFSVKIKTPAPEATEKVFQVSGVEKESVEGACLEILKKTESNGSPEITQQNYNESESSFTLSSFYNAASKRMSSMMVIAAKNLLSYTLVVNAELEYEDGKTVEEKVILDVELIGLQCSTTQATTLSWLNSEETNELLKNCQERVATILGMRGKVSLEAMGFSRSNTRHNLHGLFFTADNECINETLLRDGLCKVLQTSIYWDPVSESRCEKVRTFLPYCKHLLVVASRESRLDFCWSDLEYSLLKAERQAAQESIGIWKQTSITASISLVPTRSPGCRRFLFIDNSNIWISGKNFKGDKEGLGMDALKFKAKKIGDLNDTALRSNIRYHPFELIQQSRAAKKVLSDRRPYYFSDHSWRLDYIKLLHLVGYDKNLDPKFTVAGSVPPANEEIWKSIRSLGSATFLSERTRENVASCEDTELTRQILKNFIDMNVNDEIVLFAGDRCFRRTLEDARAEVGNIRIYVVAWAHTCFHRLKHMQDNNTFFINLDPYLDYLTISVPEIKELRSESRLVNGTNENRVVAYHNPRSGVTNFIPSVEDYLQSELILLKDRDFVIVKTCQRNVTVVHVLFTSKCRDAGALDQLKSKFPPADWKTPTTSRPRGVLTPSRCSQQMMMMMRKK